jgi:hypothetical protein
MKKIYLLSVLFISLSFSFAQITNVKRLTDFTVIENGDTLKDPFAGGISSPEFSMLDLNNDGIKDLVVYERDGDRFSCFLNSGIPGKIDYKYAPQYHSKFPQGLKDWALFRDYNGDGKEDLFTQGRYGIKIYKNTSVGADLSFLLVMPDIIVDYGGSSIEYSANIVEMPEITDLDSDGDLDILAFYGSRVRYIQNKAIELTGSADTLTKFFLMKECWGRFSEDVAGCIVHLESGVNYCATGEKPAEEKNNSPNRHSGSSILIFDANGDGKKDALIGDAGCSNLYLVTNTNSDSEAIMTSVEYNYPPSDPIDIFECPKAVYLDINNDGKRDLLVAPKGYRGVQNHNSTWLYLNNGTDASPDFSLHTKSFLQDEMIDVGQNAYPYFFDYNQDGKIDLAIANSGKWLKDPNATSPVIDSATITLYKNIGTNTSPVYELISRDYSNISQYDLIYLSMSTADLDEDGDEDLILGNEDGRIHYFSNVASPGAPANFQLHTPLYQNIDLGRFSVPQLIDLNEDDKADLILGGKALRNWIHLYSDTSESSVLPEFKYIDTLTNTYNAVLFGTGPSMFFNVNYDQKGNHALFMDKGGMINFFDSVARDLSSELIRKDSIKLSMGTNVKITMQDVNGDGNKELIAGTSAGGLAIYELTYKKDSVQDGLNDERRPDHLFSVYPNPANYRINISSTNNEKILKIELYDLLGKQVMLKDHINQSRINISSQELNTGNYILRIYSEQSLVNKLVMIHH